MLKGLLIRKDSILAPGRLFQIHFRPHRTTSAVHHFRGSSHEMVKEGVGHRLRNHFRVQEFDTYQRTEGGCSGLESSNQKYGKGWAGGYARFLNRFGGRSHLLTFIFAWIFVFLCLAFSSYVRIIPD